MNRDFFTFCGGDLDAIDLSLRLMPRRFGDNKKILAGVDMAYLLEGLGHKKAVEAGLRFDAVSATETFDRRVSQGQRDHAFDYLKSLVAHSNRTAGQRERRFFKWTGGSFSDYFARTYPDGKALTYKLNHYAVSNFGEVSTIDPSVVAPSIEQVYPEFFAGGLVDDLNYSDDMVAADIEKALALSSRLCYHTYPFCHEPDPSEVKKCEVTTSGDVDDLNLFYHLGLDTTHQKFRFQSTLKSSYDAGRRDSETGEWKQARGSASRVGDSAGGASEPLFSRLDGRFGAVAYSSRTYASDDIDFVPVMKTRRYAWRQAKVKGEDRIVISTRLYEVVDIGRRAIQNAGRYAFMNGMGGGVVLEDEGFDDFDPNRHNRLEDYEEYVVDMGIELETTLQYGLALYTLGHATQPNLD